MNKIVNSIYLGLLPVIVVVAVFAIFQNEVNYKVDKTMAAVKPTSSSYNWLIVDNRMIDFVITKEQDKRYLAKLKIKKLGNPEVHYKTIGKYNSLNKAEDAAGMVMAYLEDKHFDKISDEAYNYVYDSN